MRWLQNQRVQRLVGGGGVERFSINVVARIQLSFLKPHKDPKLIKLLRCVRKERASLLTADETFMIYSLARAYGCSDWTRCLLDLPSNRVRPNAGHHRAFIQTNGWQLTNATNAIALNCWFDWRSRQDLNLRPSA